MTTASGSSLRRRRRRPASGGGGLPIYPEFKELIQSQSADLKNSYYGEAGVITGGMFIGEFVEGRPWVHLDIAGSHWNENQSHVDIPRGPLGAGTRLCYRLAELMAGPATGGDHDAGS